MRSVEIGHLYVGDALGTLDPAVTAFQNGFVGWEPLLMIDDYSRPCVDSHGYAARVRNDLETRHALRPHILFESQLVREAGEIMCALSGKIIAERFRGKRVHFFGQGEMRIKIAETLDSGEVKFSCPCLVAALSLHRRDTLGALEIVSILPAYYAQNEVRADRIAEAVGVFRRVVLI